MAQATAKKATTKRKPKATMSFEQAVSYVIKYVKYQPNWQAKWKDPKARTEAQRLIYELAKELKLEDPEKLYKTVSDRLDGEIEEVKATAKRKQAKATKAARRAEYDKVLSARIMKLVGKEKSALHDLYMDAMHDYAYLWAKVEDINKLREILLTIIKLFIVEHQDLEDLSGIDRAGLREEIKILLTNRDALLQKAKRKQIKEIEREGGPEAWYKKFAAHISRITKFIAEHEKIVEKHLPELREEAAKVAREVEKAHAKEAEEAARTEALKQVQMKNVDKVDAERMRLIEEKVGVVNKSAQDIYTEYQQFVPIIKGIVGAGYMAKYKGVSKSLEKEFETERLVAQMRKQGEPNWASWSKMMKTGFEEAAKIQKLLDKWEKKGFLSIFEAHYLLFRAYKAIVIILTQIRSNYNRDEQLNKCHELRIWMNALSEFESNISRSCTTMVMAKLALLSRITPRYVEIEMNRVVDVRKKIEKDIQSLTEIVLLGEEKPKIPTEKGALRKEIQDLQRITYSLKKRTSILKELGLKELGERTGAEEENVQRAAERLAEFGLGKLAKKLIAEGESARKEVLGELMLEISKRKKQLKRWAKAA